MLQRSAAHSTMFLPQIWSDASRFMTEFLEPISFGALHIYASALPFCPTDTQLSKHYHGHTLVKVQGGQQKRKWSQNVWTRHVGGAACAIKISPSGEILALGNDK